MAAVIECIDDGGVEQNLGTGVLQQIVSRFAPDQGIVGKGECFSVAEGIGNPASLFHHIEKAVGKTEYDFFGRGRPVVRGGV